MGQLYYYCRSTVDSAVLGVQYPFNITHEFGSSEKENRQCIIICTPGFEKPYSLVLYVLTYIAKLARLPVLLIIPTCHTKFCKALTLIWTWFRPCKSICIGKLQFNSINTLLYCVKTCKLFL